MGYLIKPIHMSEDAKEKMRCQAIEAALKKASSIPHYFVDAGSLISRKDCTEEHPCCDRRGQYNGVDSGPLWFVCPKHCSCHD